MAALTCATKVWDSNLQIIEQGRGISGTVIVHPDSPATRDKVFSIVQHILGQWCHVTKEEEPFCICVTVNPKYKTIPARYVYDVLFQTQFDYDPKEEYVVPRLPHNDSHFQKSSASTTAVELSIIEAECEKLKMALEKAEKQKEAVLKRHEAAKIESAEKILREIAKENASKGASAAAAPAAPAMPIPPAG